MENNDPKFTSIQPDLFQRLDQREPEYLSANAPDLYIEPEFMGAVAYALREAKKHGLSRERIVERMNLCLPEEQHITKRQLDAWCAQSKEHNPFPAKYLPAFIWAVRGIVSPIEVITRALGLVVLDEQEQLAAELGRAAMAKAEAAKRERTIKQKLGT